jgi:hypothetical protein
MLYRALSVPALGLLILSSSASAVADAPSGTSQLDSSKLTDTISAPGQPSGSPAGSKDAKEETPDDVLTNNNLRALSGSASKWSIASQFNYNGGTISDPLSQYRPNISAGSGVTDRADLDGSISVKYNFNARHSLQAGIGIRWIAPLSGGPTDYAGTTFDVINPYVTYQYLYKWFGIQSVLQATLTQWTQADQTAIGSNQQYNVDQENMFEVPGTNLSIGASTIVQYQTFNKDGAVTLRSGDFIPNLHDVQSQYLFTVAPIVEYQLSEKINLRTYVNIWTYEHYISQQGFFAFTRDSIYQSVGVGISVTRDIFLYPNIQFLPTQLQAALTNVGLQATVNVF